MTPRGIGFFSVVVCFSALVGSLLGLFCRGRIVLSIMLGLLVSALVFAALEWRFGSPEEWSWQYPLTSVTYLVAPFLLLVATPTVAAAVFVGRWCLRRKVI
jgi:hypothetical protein